MKALIQRVASAAVEVDGQTIASIQKGLLVFIGIGQADQDKDIEYVKKKILNLRIFEDERGFFHYSVQDIGGQVLLVSQFTLYGDCKNGNRPSFTESMPVAQARDIYAKVCQSFKQDFPQTYCGIFQASMQVSLINDGPVTIQLDSKN